MACELNSNFTYFNFRITLLNIWFAKNARIYLSNLYLGISAEKMAIFLQSDCNLAAIAQHTKLHAILGFELFLELTIRGLIVIRFWGTKVTAGNCSKWTKLRIYLQLFVLISDAAILHKPTMMSVNMALYILLWETALEYLNKNGILVSFQKLSMQPTPCHHLYFFQHWERWNNIKEKCYQYVKHCLRLLNNMNMEISEICDVFKLRETFYVGIHSIIHASLMERMKCCRLFT